MIARKTTPQSQVYNGLRGIWMKKPNIVFILIDDLGWKDIACCGSEFYETPNLDKLASQGVRFTDAYASCPVCSPTSTSAGWHRRILSRQIWRAPGKPTVPPC